MNEEKALEEMSRLAGTQTEKICAPLSREAQAHVKYNLFAGEARKIRPCPGRLPISLKKPRTRKELMRKSGSGSWGSEKDTAEHLKMAAKGKMMNGLQCIRSLLKLQKEGFPQIAFLMTKIGEIEKQHERRYKILLANVENGKLFKRDEKKLWMCANCGFTCESVEAPEECPVCNHPRSFFAIKAENY